MLSIPIALSLATVIGRSYLLFALLILVHFLVIKKIPAFKGRENVWTFIIVAMSYIPLNIYLLYLMHGWGLLFNSFLILGIFRCVLYYTILLSMEEVVMGVITRFLWRKQYKIF